MWALVGRGPAGPDPKGASPSSLAGNTVFHFSKDSKGTGGPLDAPSVVARLSVCVTKVPENWLSYNDHLLRPQSTFFLHQKRPTSRAVRAVLPPFAVGYGHSGLVWGGVAIGHIIIFLFMHLWLWTNTLGVAFREYKVKTL